MSAADKPALMRILKNTPEFKPFEVLVAEELVDYYLSDGVKSGYNILIADDEGVAGYVCYGETPCTVGTWDIYWIAVDHTCQGHGIGHELMAITENNIRRAGGKLIVLETSSTPLYDRTNRFYIRLNYTQASRIADYYGPADDQITYIKRF